MAVAGVTRRSMRKDDGATGTGTLATVGSPAEFPRIASATTTPTATTAPAVTSAASPSRPTLVSTVVAMPSIANAPCWASTSPWAFREALPRD